MMSQPEFWVQTAAVYYFLFAVFHLSFWKLFSWRWQLRSLSSVNRAIVQVMNLCLIFYFCLMGYLFWWQTEQILATGIGRMLILAGVIFWALRIILQLIYFPRRNSASWLFILVCMLGVVIHSIPLSQIQSMS